MSELTVVYSRYLSCQLNLFIHDYASR